MKVKCATCGKGLRRRLSRIKRSKHHFCSLRCKGKWWAKNLTGKNAYNYKNATLTGQCEICGKKIVFLKIRPQTFCSYQCYGVGQRKRISLKCDGCGRQFQRPKSYVYWHGKRGCHFLYCSLKCRLKHAIEDKTPNWIKDRTKLRAGVNNAIRNSFKMNRWKRGVLRRDNFTCQICGKKKTDKVTLNVHHVERFAKNKKRWFDTKNGLTVCYLCHKKIHFDLSVK